jgi:hypothetical protein
MLNPDLRYHGIPLKYDPVFDNLDTAPYAKPKPAVNPARYRIGGEWLTKHGARVKIINQHSDLDYEVTVLKAAFTPEKGDETRGLREGSSYMVDSWGKVKPGALAPGWGMDLAKDVDAVKSDTHQLRDAGYDVAQSVNSDTRIRDVLGVHLRFATASSDDTKIGWLRDLMHEIAKVEIAKDIAAVRADVRKEIDQAIKAYDASRLKILVGKTYVTRNGSQIQVEQIARDGHVTGRITRGGTASHGFKAAVGFRKDGKFAGDHRQLAGTDDHAAWNTEHPLDIQHEVL